jgi:hypothetical protein
MTMLAEVAVGQILLPNFKLGRFPENGHKNIPGMFQKAERVNTSCATFVVVDSKWASL